MADPKTDASSHDIPDNERIPWRVTTIHPSLKTEHQSIIYAADEDAVKDIMHVVESGNEIASIVRIPPEEASGLA